MAPSLQQKLFVEFVGTALLCFTVSCLPKVAEDMVGITVGGVLMLLVYAGGPQSGGHYNPAVTLAILIRKGIEAKEICLSVLTGMRIPGSLTENDFLRGLHMEGRL